MPAVASLLFPLRRIRPRDLGRAGEARGVWFYRWRGYSVLERNLRFGDGEIDLVVRRRRVLAFVEIKTRQTTDHGSPQDAVDRRKQLQIARLAARFLASRKLDGIETVRFDVLSLFWNRGRFEIEWFPGAFVLESESGRPWHTR